MYGDCLGILDSSIRSIFVAFCRMVEEPEVMDFFISIFGFIWFRNVQDSLIYQAGNAPRVGGNCSLAICLANLFNQFFNLSPIEEVLVPL